MPARKRENTARSRYAQRRVVADRLLSLVKQEAETVVDDLELLVRSAGLVFHRPEFSELGLKALEATYWQVVEAGEVEVIELFERKMAIFLGEAIIRVHGGASSRSSG